MSARFCTIEAASEDAARKAGAEELGSLPRDVSVEAAQEGSYRVTVVNAPSILEVAVQNEDMLAVVTKITPTLGNYPNPSMETVEGALSAIGVTVGLLADEIREMIVAVTESGFERTDVTVARGLLPRPGADAQITRHYLRPTEEAPDRRQRIVREGETLIERLPATLGEVGLTVTGQTLPVAAGQDVQVIHGEGIVGDEEGLCWTASIPSVGYLEIDEQGCPRVVPLITIGEDRLSAHLDLRAPGADEPAITRPEVDAAIEAAGMVYGLSEERVEEAMSTYREQGYLPQPALIAQGEPARSGADASIAFELEHQKLVGNVDEKIGRIDFRERHMVTNVREGQHIATWNADMEGIPGRTIDGEELPAEDGAPTTFAAKENVVTVELEDGSLVFEAGIDGMLLVSDDNELSVVKLLEVRGDVDYETGHIDAEGCVVISGSVRGRFRVTATEDITVQGSVEDAIVHAGRSLEVGAGIIGGKNGRVSAESHVTAKFIQNAKVSCAGDVEILESDMNSVIECRGRLLATGRRGKLRGGRYTALQGLKAMELGSDLGVPTTVSVGTDSALAREMREVQDKLRAIQAMGREIQRARTGGLGRETTPGLDREHIKAVREYVAARREQPGLEARLKELQEQLLEGEPPTVDVTGTVHAGVDIYIRGTHLHVDEAVNHVRFYYDLESRQVEAVPLNG